MQEKYKRYNSAYDLIRDKIIIPRIVTNITLSDTAKSFAKSLGVEYMENFKLEMYPLIKCNINNGEKYITYRLINSIEEQIYQKRRIYGTYCKRSRKCRI